MTSPPSRPRVPPSVLLVSGVPAVSAVLGASAAAWIVTEVSGGLMWWACPVAIGSLWWAAGRSTAILTVEITRDLKEWQQRKRD